MTDSRTLDRVMDQYDAFVFPPRNAEDDHHRLLHTAGGDVFAINHFCFGGKKDFSRGFRCLVAGGGTGDCVIFLAEQLKGFDAEIVYLDFSVECRDVAKERAQIRGLDNIKWVTGSLLDIPKMNLGSFDFINCAGVLHLLESPEDGLATLADALVDGGGMYLMLYGKYGMRHSHYAMRRLLSSIIPPGTDVATQVSLTRELIDALPASHPFKRDIALWGYELSHDNGVYDLLLSERDVCYSVPEVYDFAATADLDILGFTGAGAAHATVAGSLAPGPLLEVILAQDLQAQQSIAEQFHDDVIAQEFFVGKNAVGPARLDDERNSLLATKSLYVNAPRIAQSMSYGQNLNYSEGDRRFTIVTSALVQVMFAQMGGRTTLQDLYAMIAKQVPGADIDQIKTQVANVFDVIHRQGLLYLLEERSFGTKTPDYGKFLSVTAA